MSDFPKNNADRTISDRLETAADNVSEMAHRRAKEATQTATDRAEAEMQTAADAADAAAREFDPSTPQAQIAEQVAAGLGDLAGTLREMDLNAVSGKVTQMARENPVLFLGGAALLGFAAARFLKASEANPPASRAPASDDPWTGHVTGHSGTHAIDTTKERRA